MSARVVDKKRTAEARARHAAGVERLNQIFGFDAGEYESGRRAKRLAFPNVERQIRRAKNKAARAARRRNRA